MKKGIDVETLKSEIQNYDVPENTWRDSMLMVTNLCKSHGVKLKDLKNNREDLDAIYPYIAEMLSAIAEPNISEYYVYESLEKVFNSSNDDAFLSQVIKSSFYFKSDFCDNPRDIAHTTSKICSDLALPVIKDISANSKLVRNFSMFLISKYGAEALKRLDSFKGQNQLELTQDVYDFYIECPENKNDIECIFKSNIKTYYKDMSKFIKNGLINRIITIINFFRECGYLESIIDVHNKAMTNMKLDFLSVTMGENKEKFNILNLESDEYLSKLDVSELFVLSAFYTNRLEKVFERLSDGVYLQMKLGTLYEMLESGEIPRNIDSDDAKIILKQKKFLDKLSKTEFEKFKEKIKNGAEPKEEDFTYIPDEYIENYQNAYKEYFDRYIPKEENNFIVDYQCAFLNRTHSYILYFLKDFSIESFLYTLSDKNSKVNFGIVEEERKKVNEYGEKQILIGVDLKEYTTIMLHFPEKDFKEFVKQIFEGRKFPKYYGNEDLEFRTQPIKTHIAYKFTKSQKQQIKKLYETMDKKNILYPYVRHLYWNIHPAQNPLNSKKKDIEI